MKDRVPVRGETLCHEVRGTGETVLYDEAGSQLLVLNETGAATWLLVDGHRSTTAIADIIEETLDVERLLVEREVDSFLKELEEKGLMSWR